MPRGFRCQEIGGDIVELQSKHEPQVLTGVSRSEADADTALVCFVDQGNKILKTKIA